MIRDARRVESGDAFDGDVCIVGAGPAGITVARDLVAAGLRVIVVAGGGLRPDRATQALAEGESSGHPYAALDACRRRAFGGTTHAWGGWSRPFDADDFTARDWIPESGWPFQLRDLAPDLARAIAHLGLGAVADEPETWPRPVASAQFCVAPAVLSDAVMRVAPVAFASRHLPALEDATNAVVLLHAHAISITMTPDGARATGACCGTLDGRRFTVTARTVVVAAGGIETARLLLASPGHGAAGIGNRFGLVGRYFGDHLHVHIGEVRVPSPGVASYFRVHSAGAHVIRGGLRLTPEVRRAHRLLGSAITLHNAEDPHDLLSPAEWRGGYESFMHLAKALLRGAVPDAPLFHLRRALLHNAEVRTLVRARLRPPPARRLLVGLRGEQAPSHESRVVLGGTRDHFGVPVADVRWRISAQDLDSIARTQALVIGALQGEQVTAVPAEGELGWIARIRPAAHHMGTTRMNDDPRRGVVDAQGRVHGVDNLYVAGSATFPTGGWAPPTVMIVTLAVRLARELKSVLGQ